MRKRLNRRAVVLAALAPALALASGVATAAAPKDPFAGLQVLTAAELDQLRGGFFAVAGWEIAFAVEARVEVDGEFRMRTWLNPFGQGGFDLNANGEGLRRLDDGTVETVGDPTVTTADGATSFGFRNFTAKLEEQDGGFSLQTDGERPVSLSQDGRGVIQRVGSPTTTLAEIHGLINRVGAMLTNTQDGAHVVQLTTFSIDILNHGAMVGPTSPLNRGNLRMSDLIGRTLVNFR